MVYDVFDHNFKYGGGRQEAYSIYVVARHKELDSGKVSHVLYQHDIEKSGNNRDLVQRKLKLQDNMCADFIKVLDQVIVLTCIQTGEVSLVDRKNMEILNERITLPDNEVFAQLNSSTD